jgi:formylglycine-generating enzyme required for sulfatase activity
LLGQGGFGAVYRAWDIRLRHACAVKENLGPIELSRQFEREATILANLSHPHLPRVMDHFIVPGQGQYLVMDLVEGKDLQELVEAQQGPVPESQAVGWIVQAAEAVEYLHNQKPPIIHRDIKPANIILANSGNISLVDFGLSKIYDPQLKTTLGAHGVSPGYSPQEQYGRGKTDIRSDIYALGATLYCLLTGIEPPESVQRNLGTTLTPPRAFSTAISPLVEQAVLKAMEMQPVKRFQSVAAFKSALIGASYPSVRRPQIQGSMQPISAGSQAASELNRVRLPRIFWVGLLIPVITIVVIFGFTILRGSSRKNGVTQSQTAPLELQSTYSIKTESGQVTPIPVTEPVVVTLNPLSDRLPEVYIVAQGDTCSELAGRFNVTTEEIWRMNNLPGSCEQLSAGQKLLIPDSSDEVIDLLSVTETSGIPAGTIRLASKDGMQLVYVPAGVFWRGSENDESQSRPDEKPKQAMYLDAFWLDRTEVTNSMYASCVRGGACEMPAQTSSQRNLFYYGQEAFDDYPVIYVSWSDAERYCRWAGRRLPSEAEWEKAARGVDSRIYPWGNVPASGRLANYDNQVGDSTRTGSYPGGASPYGVLDMAGNVAEWVADWFDPRYYLSTAVINPIGPDQGEFRVQRGGSWLSQAHVIRTAYRLRNYPSSNFEGIGFRCAVSNIEG